MTARLPGRAMVRAFFDNDVEHVAPRLLGKLLVRSTRAGVIAGRIVEVEAYLGPHHETPDRAAHSHRGPTPRNEVMFGPPGHAYVYSIYGRYFCMNITCEPKGRAGCVLIRALEPVTGIAAMARNRGVDARTLDSKSTSELEKRSAMKEAATLTSGPSRLCQALDITRPAHNGLDLLDPRSVLQVRDDGFRVTRAQVTVRIGITHAAELPLRFCLEGHGCVSGPKRMPGSLIAIH